MAKTIHKPPGFEVEEYLQDCAFYPCSHMHGLPIELLAQEDGLRRFFYVDYSVSLAELEARLEDPGFAGYRHVGFDMLAAEHIFGVSWDTMSEFCRENLEPICDDWNDPFIALVRFERKAEFGSNHGPLNFELLFACCEALSAYHFAFTGREIAPSCLIYINPGISFGGNFAQFPDLLSREVRNNKAGLPRYLLHDKYSKRRKYGSYLDLIPTYNVVNKFKIPTHGKLTLRES